MELIVGCRRDPAFGLMLVIGLGGISAEILRDTAVALGPVDALTAETLLLTLRGSSLLQGARGKRPLDLARAADFAARLSLLAAAHPELADVEVNPLLVLPDRVMALDARLALAANGAGGA